MKIAVIAHLEFPISPPYAGGLEKHSQVLCDVLSSKGHEVVLYADPRSEIKGEVAEVCQSSENFAYYHLKKEDLEFHQSYLSKHYTYMSFMRDICNDPTIDIVHNNSLHYLPVSFASQLNCPIVSVLHTPPLRELEMAYAIKRPDNHKTIAVSSKLAEEWLPHVEADYIVHNGTSVKNVPHEKKVEKGATNKSAFWFGRITPEKGTKDAVLAAKRAHTPIDIAGPISNEEYYKKEILPLLDENCRYIGHLDEEQICQKLRQSLVVLITPKWEEPFGLVAIEAMAQGAPIAAYARGALPEIISENTGELCRPDDIEELSMCLLKAMNKDRLECHKEAFKRFSIERMTLEYEAIYKLSIEQYYENRLLHSSRRLWAFAKGQINRSLLS